MFIKHYEGEQSIFPAFGTDFSDGGREYKAYPFAQAAWYAKAFRTGVNFAFSLFLIEKGTPTVAIGSYLQVLFVLGLENDFLLKHTRDWKFSPVYDINPNPHTRGLSLNINEDSYALDLELAIEVAKYFKVSKRDAKETVQDFADTISERWDIYESDYGISKSEQDYYSPAFSAAMDWAK